ncbi:MAG: ABC transporter ATP-binding protein [Clostridia bacterium]|nr:ABC transporter ATP-binding protein [Clostridia bacterium]
MSDTRILDVRDLRVTFDTMQGSVQAVRGVSFHVDAGETIGIVGESGCGKSVTVKTALGLNSRSSGSVKGGQVLFEGKDILDLDDRAIRDILGNRMSMIFQDPFTYLNPTMPVGRQITESYLRHHKATRKEAEEKALQILRLISLPNPEATLRRYPHQLSGGMRQRIMIAMALICSPAVLFADEPTTALDVTIQAQIIDLMNDLKEKTGTSIVLITHDMGVVAKMADRIYVMYAGKIVEEGDADTIFHRPRHPYTFGLLDSVPRLDERTQDELHSIPGMPPDLIAPPEGCPFARRCRYAMKICERVAPPEIQMKEDGHVCSCWLCEEHCIQRRGEVTREGGVRV